ncbi:ribonuclease HII [Pararhodobacter oceanensis]|uniref:Ribonuclease HII n=1 Tax=Pararhodobacter oceanensis TaxID=2172121 RepID=A0A2T8HSW0_9RHOB|nr:ribonuclease HII [Pararhodobacter oceanensis]PVH28540.1 ribonuclease HII [Pararhodobacter oceanensis]
MPSDLPKPATKPAPDFALEDAAKARGFARIAGVDEVGRGPLAGPVTAAAVILDPARLPQGINDSKRLNETARLRLAAEIKQMALAWSIAHATVAEIDQLNILHASLFAMDKALQALAPAADFALVDGNRLPPAMAQPAQTVVKGDARSLSIAAASILAKVERDRIMRELALEHPDFGWDRNMGYPTAQHREALIRLGPTPHHRISFAPVRKMLC